MNRNNITKNKQKKRNESGTVQLQDKELRTEPFSGEPTSYPKMNRP